MQGINHFKDSLKQKQILFYALMISCKSEDNKKVEVKEHNARF